MLQRKDFLRLQKSVLNFFEGVVQGVEFRDGGDGRGDEGDVREEERKEVNVIFDQVIGGGIGI